MKKILTLALLTILFISCSSDDDSGTPLPTAPEAQAQYDNSNYGLYKGVFVGSSGVVVININNNGEVNAKLVIDGTSHDFTTTETVNENSAINGLTFTMGGMSFDFNVGSDGSFPYVNNINMSGHPNAAIEVVKEQSDMLVECFKGTYNGDDSGVFNIIIAGDQITGIGSSNDDGEPFYLDGVKSGNSITGYFDGGGFTGTDNGNSVSGTWENMFEESGNFTGQRKL